MRVRIYASLIANAAVCNCMCVCECECMHLREWVRLLVRESIERASVSACEC